MTDNGVVHVIDAVLVPARTTIVDVVVNSEDHNTLEAAVLAAGLAGVLSGDGPFTLFAPTDAAFAALPAGTLEALLADPSGALTDILTYHVLAGSVKSTDLSDGMTATTLLGRDIKVTINADGVFINDAKVTVADILTDNGVVHVIDAVLVPAAPATVWDIIRYSPSHKTLEAAINAAGLSRTLSGAGRFTVFAPTDAAFAALPEGTLEALLSDAGGMLKTLLLSHVIKSEILAGQLRNNMIFLTLGGKVVKIAVKSDGVYVENAKVTVTDLKTNNGVVHVVDAVILPPTTVMDVIAGSANHETLEAAIKAAGLNVPLRTKGPFTVFAPTDAAFAALPAGTVETLLADPMGLLADILRYHVVSGRVYSGSLYNGMTAFTLMGGELKVTINAEGIYINNAKVTVADIETGNGIVHVIDAVMIPEITENEGMLAEGSSDAGLKAAEVGSGAAQSRITGNDAASGRTQNMPGTDGPAIGFSLYPNPATTSVTIDLGIREFNSTSTLRIMQMDGRILDEIRVNDSRITYNTAQLLSGMYMVVLQHDNRVYTDKLIVR